MTHGTFDMRAALRYNPTVRANDGGTIVKASERLKIGEAVHIRLMPREVMTCIAITRLVAPDAKNLSLAQAVRIAITELCEAAIKTKVVAAPDEYEYEATTETYRRSSMARKVQTTKAIMQMQMERVVQGDTAALGGLQLRMPETEEEERARVRANAERLLAEDRAASRPVKRVDPRLHRFNELKFRSEQDPLNMSKQEFREMKQLARALGATA